MHRCAADTIDLAACKTAQIMQKLVIPIADQYALLSQFTRKARPARGMNELANEIPIRSCRLCAR